MPMSTTEPYFRRELYELLVRCAGDRVLGMSVRYLEGQWDPTAPAPDGSEGDWVPGQVSPGQPKAVADVDEADRPTLAVIMGELAHGLQVTIDEQQQQLAAAQAELAAKDGTAQQLLEQVDQLQGQLAAAQRDLATATTAAADAEQLRAELIDVRGQLAQALQQLAAPATPAT